MYCHKCKKKLPEGLKTGFHSTCENCGADLHSCANCRFYAKGKPNDCNVPMTDPIVDREKANYCEEFVFSKDLPDIDTSDISKAHKRLFKDGEAPKKRDFDTFFND